MSDEVEEIPGDDVPMPPEGWFEEHRTHLPDDVLEGLEDDD